MYSLVRKQRSLACGTDVLQLQRNIVAHQEDAALVVALMNAGEEGSVRRTVERAHGKWRGSTLMGYLGQGDETTYRANFRMTKAQLKGIIDLLRGSRFDLARQRHGYERGRHGNMTAKACIAQDVPTLDFKVAACMYSPGQERRAP